MRYIWGQNCNKIINLFNLTVTKIVHKIFCWIVGNIILTVLYFKWTTAFERQIFVVDVVAKP